RDGQRIRRARCTLSSINYLPCPTLQPLSLFQRSTHPRNLHSFPTRRSSDLSRSCSARTNARPAPPSSARRTGSRLSRSRVSASRDRKSTRLNSSHDQISYAVFCLKKKLMLYVLVLVSAGSQSVVGLSLSAS